MKWTLLLLICFILNISCTGTTGKFFNKLVHTNTGAVVSNQEKFLIDEFNNKYQLNLYRYNVNFGNTTLASSVQLNNASFFSWSYFIAKFDSTDNFSKASTLFSGDSIFNVTTSYYDGHFYVLLTYCGKIYTANDSLVSAGDYDIGLFKFNSNFDLVNKLNIGGIKSETTTNQNLEVKNGKIYLGGNFFANNPNNTYVPYSLIIGNDTLYCDNKDSNSKTEYFVSVIDTNLVPIKSKSGGGLNVNSCNILKVEGTDIYLVVNSNSNTMNNAFGIWFNYVTAFENKFYILKLDGNLNAKWMRKFGTTATDFLKDLKLTTTPNALLVTGITDRMGATSGGGGYGGGGGSSVPNKVFMDYGSNLIANPLYPNDNFSFAFMYDTAGQFKWTSNLVPIKDAAYDTNTDKIICIGTRFGHSSINGDTLINCGNSDSYILSLNTDSASLKLIDKICGTKEDLLTNITISNSNKVYTSGNSKSGTIECTTFTHYLNDGMNNLFYTQVDSITFFPLNSSNLEISTNISIYPNPCNDVLNILLPSSIKEKTIISIMDISGREIVIPLFEWTGNNRIRISLGKLAKGSYFLKVKTIDDISTIQFTVN